MSEARHTPGPWRTKEGSEVIAEEFTEEGNPNLGRIAITVYPYVEAEADEVFANARLIAAAPDLLTALEKMALGEITEDDGHEDCLVFVCNECDAGAEHSPYKILHDEDCETGEAFAAIAAARGEAQL